MGMSWFSECLRKEMRRQKISQSMLADMMDLEDTTIYRWVTGQHIPRDKAMKEILDTLDCHFVLVPNKEENK